MAWPLSPEGCDGCPESSIQQGFQLFLCAEIPTGIPILSALKTPSVPAFGPRRLSIRFRPKADIRSGNLGPASGVACIDSAGYSLCGPVEYLPPINVSRLYIGESKGAPPQYLEPGVLIDSL